MKTFSDLRQNLIESELLNEESYQYGEISDKRRFDAENPEILIKGVGKSTLSTLKHNIAGKLKDLADKAEKDQDWNFINEALNEKGILTHYVRAILDVESQLKSPIIKRKITLMKKEEAQKVLRKNIINEVAPPDPKIENWILKNKARFIKEYGKEKGLEVLYASAWRLFNEKK